MSGIARPPFTINTGYHLEPAAPPNNLPAQLTTFIGRASERADVLRLLRSARLVTLTGPEAPAEAADYAFFLHRVDDLADPERHFALTAAESAPLWEGQCATARWWANRLVCGTDVVDPATGETAPLPAGAYAGSNAETLVLRDGDT